LGIDWSNVDLDKGVVRIERSLQRMAAGQPLVVTGLKTERARRAVGLPRAVVERLRQHRAEQAKRRLALGPAWNTVTDEHDHEVDLVCRTGDGKPVSPDDFSKAFKKIAVKAGRDPRTRLHDVRHQFATELGRSETAPCDRGRAPGPLDPGVRDAGLPARVG
jgi:integrase